MSNKNALKCLRHRQRNRFIVEGKKIFGTSACISLCLFITSICNVATAHQASPLSSTFTTSELSLPSSSVLTSQAMGGALTVSNGTGRDAHVKLIEPSSRVLVGSFLVKSNSSYTLEQIPDGTYRVLFVLGQGWNPNTQSFTKNKNFAKFDKSLAYVTTQLGNSIRYKAFKITLHTVVGGNTTTSGLSEAEFNRY
jgi:hypothetical protein